MTSAKFWVFLTPSPPCLHFGPIHSTKFTQPPLLHLLLGYPPPPLPLQTSYVHAPLRHLLVYIPDFIWHINCTGLGSNGVIVTKFLKLLMILELYLELSYFFSWISIVVTVTEVTKVPKFLT